MIELIAFALAVVAALIWFFLQNKKQAHGTRPKNLSDSAKPIQQEIKPADKVAAPAKPVVAPPLAESKPLVAEQANKVVSLTPENSLLPQDSMLKRHYLTHLRAMIDSLSPCPTDLALSRHHNTQITAVIEQCLNNEAAMAKLICQYGNCKKIPTAPAKVAETLIQSETTSETVVSVTAQIPEDSMLRRHYNAMLASN
ncbi:MAG: hypothetical protein EXR80_09695 [Methylococcales bacterium]|nr:hypothetical protein [Methylococcales bacterium]